MTIETVGVREFRADLASYIDRDEPIALTRHGKTVGLFIPTQVERAANMAAFRQAADRLDEMLDLDDQMPEILGEFKRLRNSSRTSK